MVHIDAEEPLTLRAGHKYVRNDGKVILIKDYPHTDNDKLIFIDEISRNLYDVHGIHDDRDLDDDWNIAGPYVPKER
jgi:hypothetical protein